MKTSSLRTVAQRTVLHAVLFPCWSAANAQAQQHQDVPAANALFVPPLALPPVVVSQTPPVEPLPVQAVTTSSNPIELVNDKAANAHSENAASVNASASNTAAASTASSERLPEASDIGADASGGIAAEGDTKAAPTAENTMAAFTPAPAEGFVFNPWQSASIGGLLLLFLAGGGATLVRFKNRGLLPSTRAEKLMQISGTLSVGPKRQLLMVRVKGEEFVISSTEHGISFLTRIGAEDGRSAHAELQTDLHNDASDRAPRSKLVTARSAGLRAALSTATAGLNPTGATEPSGSVSAPSTSTSSSTGTSGESVEPSPKSEILLSALRNMREKNAGKANAKGIETRAQSAKDLSAKVAASQNANTNSKASTQPASSAPRAAGTGTAFPRYLANAFAEEGRREISRPIDANEEVQVESVTNLIREKLREMKPLA